MEPPVTDAIAVLSRDGKPTGEIAGRTEVHRFGLPHRAIHLYILNDAGQLLVQRRGSHVDHLPGVLTVSVAGHVDAGETSAEAVYRELQEELGVSVPAEQITFAFSRYNEAMLDGGAYIDRHFNDVYVLRLDQDLTMLTVDGREVHSVTWMPFSDFAAMAAAGVEGIPAVYAHEMREIGALLGVS